ncbi:MAG: hypothetical protein ACI902_000932 [Psychroserpens sp.]|jgi:hypothetical protein
MILDSFQNSLKKQVGFSSTEFRKNGPAKRDEN